MEHLLREFTPQVLAAVARRHDDFGAAEDAVQEALIAAAEQWPSTGVPDNPKGWLFRVAVRRLTDHVRSELARHRREESAATLMMAEAMTAAPDDIAMEIFEDDTLTLLFMCCHPMLTPASAIALTLRAVGGLTTGEVARAFMVPEATMAQRVSRAKQTIKNSRVPFASPGAGERAERLDAVLHVLYLMFNEGYASSAGPDLARPDLSNEAIRLTRMALALIPQDAEVAGLLALMLFTDARRAARTGSAGELIPLDEQDRSLWNRNQVEEGQALLASGLARGAVGTYQLQALIAALHDSASSTVETDWPHIVALYGLLGQMSDNPMVALNHAVSVAMVQGPAAGLALLEELDNDARISGHYRLDAVRGHLYERAGDRVRARAHYAAAAAGTPSSREREYLIAKGLGMGAES